MPMSPSISIFAPKNVSEFNNEYFKNRHALEKITHSFRCLRSDKSRENPYFVRGGSRLLSKFAE
jgi:hypothetical protein